MHPQNHRINHAPHRITPVGKGDVGMTSAAGIMLLLVAYGAMRFFDTPLLDLVFVGLVGAVATFAPAGGACAVVMSLPLSAAPFPLFSMPFPVAVLLATLVGTGINALVIGPGVPRQRPLAGVAFVCILGLAAVLGSGHYHRLPHLGVFALSLVYCIILYGMLAHGRLKLASVVLALGAATIIAVIPELQAQQYLGSAKRLGIEGNVRALANAAGFALVGATVLLLGHDPRRRSIGSNVPSIGTFKTAALVVVIVVSTALAMATISRGVLLSSGIATAAAFALATVRDLLTRHYIPLRRFVVMAVAIVPAVWQMTGEVGARVVIRMEGIEQGADHRLYLWQAATQEMTPWQVVFGSGIATFRDLAAQGGGDGYAHSAFVDTFVSFGLIGLIGLLVIGAHIVWTALRENDLVSLGLAFFLMVAYSTHGGLNSIAFLVLGAIVWGNATFTRNIHALQETAPRQHGWN